MTTTTRRLLTAIVLLGAILRLVGLETQSLWNDELLIWDRTNIEDFGTFIREGVHYGSTHPPGYALLIRTVRPYFGDSEAGLRMPSVIAGILSIVAIFFLGRRLYSEKEGLLAAALTAVSWTPIYYSQEVRSYSILILLSICTTYAWIAVLDALARNDATGARRRHVLTGVVYVVTAIACCYTHYFGLYLVALQGVAAAGIAIRNRRGLLAVALIYSPIVAAILPWVPAMLHHASAFNKGYDNIAPPTSSTVLDVPRFFFNNSRVLLPLVLLLYATFLVRYALDRVEKFDRVPPGVSPDTFLLVWLVVPFVVITAESALLFPLVTNRNLLILLPPAYLLTARALFDLPLPPRLPRAAATAGFVVLVLFQLVIVKDYYRRTTKQQFRDAIGHVASRLDAFPGSVVATTGRRNRYLNYYLRRHDSADGAYSLNNDNELGQLLDSENPSHIWFVLAPGLGSGDASVLERNGFAVEDRQSFHKVDVWLYARSREP